MYPVPDSYKEAIDSNDREYALAGTLTLGDGSVRALSDASFLSGSVSVSYDCVTGEALALGAAMAASLKATLLGLGLDRYALYGASVVLGFVLGDTTVPLGAFTVTEAVSKGDALVVSAVDDMCRTDVPAELGAASGMPYQWLTDLCGACGLRLAQSEEEVEAMPNGTVTLEMPRSGPDANWRDALCHVAQALAGFAVINRDGELEIRSFGTEPVAAVPKGRCYSLAPADYVSRHTSLSCESGTDVIVVAGEPNDGLNLAVRGNPFFDVGELADHYQTVADMYGAVKGLSYVPGQWSYAGDPALDAGDMVTIDGRDVLLTGIVFRYHAPQDLRSVGANPRYGSVVPASERRQHEAKVLTLEEIRRVQGELVDVNAQIVRTQDNIQIWVQDTYTASADYFSKVTELQSLIEQNAESISLSVGGLTTVISDLDDALTSRIDGMNTSFLIDSAGAHIRKSVDGDLGRYEVFIDDASFRIRSITPDAPPADPSEDAAAVAWIDNDDMHIHNATVVNALDLGSFRFEPRVSGNLSLVWKG